MSAQMNIVKSSDDLQDQQDSDKRTKQALEVQVSLIIYLEEFSVNIPAIMEFQPSSFLRITRNKQVTPFMTAEVAPRNKPKLISSKFLHRV